MDKTLVEIDRLQLDYGAVCAVKDVSFCMKAGEILAVIGPNGSGKTSTVECVEGLRRPTSGSVQVFGVNPLKNRSQVYREMGIQLQEAEYPVKIKVRELCGLFASFYENPADWHLLLKHLGLEEKAVRAVKKLSGGEKQRLSVLLALLPRPRLLILDELTTGLDPEIRHGLWESLRRIKAAGIPGDAGGVPGVCETEDAGGRLEGGYVSGKDVSVDFAQNECGGHGGDIMKKLLTVFRIEALLFLRDFYGFFFTFVFPLLMLLLYGSIYGNEPSAYFGGRGTMDVSVPAYSAMIIGVTGLMAFPLTLAGYKESWFMISKPRAAFGLFWVRCFCPSALFFPWAFSLRQLREI